VDPRTHRRFLEYIEKWEYFGGGGKERLSREQWLVFDAERQPLEEKARRDACTAPELARLAALRRVLLVD
jgi:hypothetical protein